jgi:hypothetical protein
VANNFIQSTAIQNMNGLNGKPPLKVPILRGGIDPDQIIQSESSNKLPTI